MYLNDREESSACGVGFFASLKGEYRHEHLEKGLHALRCVEHRGGCGSDLLTGDGAGIMTDIPFELLGFQHGKIALATLFLTSKPEDRRKALRLFEKTFSFYDLNILKYRDVPTDPKVLGEQALARMPKILHVVLERPVHCRTESSFEQLLYTAQRHTLSKLKQEGNTDDLFFSSLSMNTIVYKALVLSDRLERFYLDLQNPRYHTRFVLFHRRFSTNTTSTWDRVQPFRLLGHNGEINTIQGNRSWGYSREKSMGLRQDELLTHVGISDSGSFNEMVEALMYRSSIPRLRDILAITMPPAGTENPYYRFWSRAMEPWGGPAFISYADGQNIGARLDRNGFRPCRWAMTKEHFFLGSEAGIFDIDESLIVQKGSLYSGRGVDLELKTGIVSFLDPSLSPENVDAQFETQLCDLPKTMDVSEPSVLHKKKLFGYTKEDFNLMLAPMLLEAKEPIGSMGDTARPALFSDQPRPLFDFFYQHFAQVTNPPLDYLREQVVTDLKCYLGKRPNIFAPKELIPPAPAFELDSPVLNLAQLEHLRSLKNIVSYKHSLRVIEIDTCFLREHGVVGCRSALERAASLAVEAANEGVHILLLSDRNASYERPAVPSLLILRSVINALNQHGIRLETSVVVDSAEVRTTHQLATLIGFGATAVCPNLALEIARFDTSSRLKKIPPKQRERNFITALEHGLLKIMAKMGISVVRSYQSAKLYTALGLGPKLMAKYFPGVRSPVGGFELEDLVEQILQNTSGLEGSGETGSLLNTYQFREHNRGLQGEKHSMTNSRSKMIHKLVREKQVSLQSLELYREYLHTGRKDAPIHLRHLFTFKKVGRPLPLEKVQSSKMIMRTFGSGAMSFGAISAESQRDLILAMEQIGGRSNSGEGGENPFYFTEGIRASIKQIASGRFGVTAEYLVSAKEIQIKIAQGAKPGEGGQLMAMKVHDEIAKARHSQPHIDLISPPPQHDIYSIEDLKQLIYELKQLCPEMPVSVKLVSGANIGTIAVGVVKAGADIVHISGGDGGTGAATLSSMKHAGLPWELGLMEVHRTLEQNELRDRVLLRVDGGLSSGKDIIQAAIMGAEEFGFGKLLLIAEGCVMARICEKNTCPVGIATHDPKFKQKYKGKPEHVVRLMEYLAGDIRRYLANLGVSSLLELTGRTDLLQIDSTHKELIEKRNLNLALFLEPTKSLHRDKSNFFCPELGSLNREASQKGLEMLKQEEQKPLHFSIQSTDRAIPSTLCGELARLAQAERLSTLEASKQKKTSRAKKTESKATTKKTLELRFTGSAGQGFGAFMGSGLNIVLHGEANDSVCKSMSGGQMVVLPHLKAQFAPSENTIIGNGALYGAISGTLFIHGHAGDRFAVRNSGALAVVEGTGLHACEYMTNGIVLILGEVGENLGAGMTGGTVFLYKEEAFKQINSSYLKQASISAEEFKKLKAILEDYFQATKSLKAQQILKSWSSQKKKLQKFIPKESSVKAS